MPFTLSSCSVAPIKLCMLADPKVRIHCCFLQQCYSVRGNKSTCKIFRNKLLAVARDSTYPKSFTENDTQSFEWEDQEEIEDTGSPWEGAIIYKRNPSITHVEYCTTLERLGLGRLSTELSLSRASAMGLRVTKAVKVYPNGTPVQVSIDVTRKKQKLRLDGIIRTVLTLGCNRCGGPAAESVFSSFSLLLSDQPVEEPEVIDIGMMFGKDTGNSSEQEDDDDDDASIDWDDRLYFPLEEKEIDISKNIRDNVHLEITINAICDPGCKGFCLKCGTNLNTSKCNCSKEEVKDKTYGPLGNLRKQMERR
ncbi:DUF177 domain protein [Melia azedarach]|nr:DUF177 domain protein [Melia azedarach]